MQRPWLQRYVLYRGLPAPQAAEAGLCNYRSHESWIGAEGRRGINGTLSMTPEPGEKGMDATVVTMPAEPNVSMKMFPRLSTRNRPARHAGHMPGIHGACPVKAAQTFRPETG